MRLFYNLSKRPLDAFASTGRVHTFRDYSTVTVITQTDRVVLSPRLVGAKPSRRFRRFYRCLAAVMMSSFTVFRAFLRREKAFESVQKKMGL